MWSNLQVGLQWMLSLYNNKLNGILADEMGLGKTVQVDLVMLNHFGKFIIYQISKSKIGRSISSNHQNVLVFLYTELTDNLLSYLSCLYRLWH